MDESSTAGDAGPGEPSPAAAAQAVGGGNKAAFLRKRWKPLLLVAAVLAALAGLIVQRIRQDAANVARIAAEEAADEDKKVSRPIDPFLFGAFTLRPSETDRVESGIKPGHWTMATLEVRANFDDFRGDLVSEMVPFGVELANLSNRGPSLLSSRPAILPKMQKKLLDVALFTPVHGPQRQVASRLLSSGGRDVWNARELLTLLPAEQFFLTVLTPEIEDYRYLQKLDSIRAPRGSLDDRGAQAHYRVLLPKITAAAPLPDHALFWTNTAVVLWDGFDPKLLSSAQQQAMLDWLHWGGQLIVSGPGSLELLRGSFLDGALPAAAGDSWEMHDKTLAPLARVSPDASRTLTLVHPWTGQHLDIAGRGALVLVETDEHEPLIVERQVGRGRAVMTAFRLTQRGLVDWANYDALFNSVLLRRASRRFVRSWENRVGVAWADGVVEDSARVSQLRFFSRDAGRAAVEPPSEDRSPWKNGLPPRRYTTTTTDSSMHPWDAESQPPQWAGVATWDDQSQVSQAARESLRDAASISVPRATFVLYMLGAYVLVLVPLNWLICRVLGRVEIAWLTAPAIALVFGVLVVRLAQLNIGFDSSATEIDIVEVQGDYPRAHLTRYSLLYTSLSTDYAIELANPSAVALPFATAPSPGARPSREASTLRQESGTGASTVAPVQLRDLAVSSNATGMIHTEEMYALAGPLTLTRTTGSGTCQLHNGTGLRLHDAMIVERNERRATLGTLEPGAETTFSLPVAGKWSDIAGREKPAPAAPQTASRTIELSELDNLARRSIGAEELCLIAWTDDDLPGLNVKPAATQSRHAAIIVAHLSYGPPPPIQIDFNSRAQVADGAEDEDEVSSGVSALDQAPVEETHEANPHDPHPAGQP
ncbi:MAG TPA: hypothetical protein VHD36_06650 [Pirellulales bacterium]|nr:hypothetical protein [Pirellulales bacterium]